MKLHTLPAAALLLCAGIAIGGGFVAQDQDPRELGRPGEIHADMAKRAGEYDAVTEFRMAPDAERVKSRGSAKIESVLGGRFLMETGTGEMMGQPFELMRIWGYNSESGTFESVWTYSMSTGMLVALGQPNGEDGITWNGTWTDTEGTRSMHIELRFPNDDSHVLEIFEKGPDGEEFCMFKTTYKRKEK